VQDTLRRSLARLPERFGEARWELDDLIAEGDRVDAWACLPLEEATAPGWRRWLLVRRWADFDPASEAGIKPVAELAKVFGLPLFTERLQEDFVRRVQERIPPLLAALDRLGGGSPFWQMPPAPD
jgi:hypothetical protein